MKVFSISLVIVFSLFTFTSFAYESREPMKKNVINLGTWSASPMSSPQGHGLLDQLMKEAFNRCCKLDVKVATLPPARSLKLANNGTIDGELPRIANISGANSNYPNLLQVDIPIIPINHVAFTKKPDIHVNSWDDLKPYNVGVVTGWKILERNIKKYRTLTKFDDEKSLFNALKKGRIEVAVYSRLSGLMEIHKMGLNGIYGSNAAKFKTGKYKLYMYMHIKHKSLISKLENTLTEMKNNGSYAKIYCKTISSYLPGKEADMVIVNALKSIGAKQGKRCSDMINSP